MTDVASTPSSESPPAAEVRPTPTPSRSQLKNPLVVGAVVIVVAAVVVAVVLSGKSPAKKPTTTPIAASPAAFNDAMKTTFKSQTISLTFSLAVTTGTTSFTLTGTGGWNDVQHSGQFVENFSGSRTLDALGPLTELVVDKTLYLKFGPALSRVFPTPWLSTPLKNASKDAGAVKVPSSASKVLPQLPLLFSALPSILHVENLGTGMFDGVAVTEYRSSFNTETATASLKSLLPSQFAGVATPSTAANVTLKAAVDAQHRLRELTIDATTTKGKQATVALTISVPTFDASLSYQAPPASQVGPLSNLFGSGSGFSL